MSDGESQDAKRKRLESVIPELLKRAVEKGVEKAQEAPDSVKQFVSDRRLPKEIASYLLSQIDETKNGLFRVVAKEIRDFLEHSNLAGELQKVLTTVQFEINTTIRFSPNDSKSSAKADGSDPEGGDGDDGGSDRPPPGGSGAKGSDPPPPSDGDLPASDGASVSDSRESSRTRDARGHNPLPELKTQVSVRRTHEGRLARRSRR